MPKAEGPVVSRLGTELREKGEGDLKGPVANALCTPAWAGWGAAEKSHSGDEPQFIDGHVSCTDVFGGWEPRCFSCSSGQSWVAEPALALGRGTGQCFGLAL